MKKKKKENNAGDLYQSSLHFCRFFIIIKADADNHDCKFRKIFRHPKNYTSSFKTDLKQCL